MKETNNLELVQRVKDGMQRCLATAMSRRGLDEVLPSYGDVLCLLRLMGTPVPVSDLVTTLRRPIFSPGKGSFASVRTPVTGAAFWWN